MAYYVFSLPPDLLDTLTLRNIAGVLPPPSPEPEPVPRTYTQAVQAGSKTCTICLNASFVDVDDQRAHFRSDWHRYNVKRRLTGLVAVAEPEFASLLEGLEDSISGSASSSSDDGSSNPDAVSILLTKSHNGPRPISPTSNTPRPPRTALTWFHSPPSTQIGVYNAMFPSTLPQMSFLPALKEMQRGGPHGRRWTMLMVAGGHFAGVVVQVKRPDGDGQEDDTPGEKKKKKMKPKSDIEILRHKTFHRYTTRRKQGGSQSVNDNAKGPAKSAGAQLRRYGEQALQDDIRNLMADWAEDIISSDLIWIRASVSNRRIFYDYDDAVFRKGDERLRNFPFPTRRPTQAELTRCLNELTRVKRSYLTEEALQAQDEAYLASLPKPKPVPLVPTKAPSQTLMAPRLSEEEEEMHEKWRRLAEMAMKSRIDAFKTFWDREGAALGGINARMPERGRTILQIAAQAGQDKMVQFLLEDLRADPTVTVAESAEIDSDADNGGNASDASDAPPPMTALSRRTAYDLASTREVRNVFRRCAAARPDSWDWLGAARVPSVLSREIEDEREGRRKERRKGLKERLRERQAKQEQAAPIPIEEPPPVTRDKKSEVVDGPRKLGGSSGQQEGIMGLSAEMRAKVERERRARAAEARLKSTGAQR